MFKNATNPFLEAGFPKLMDMSKAMGGFKPPNFDMAALMEMQRKNLEMITAIQKTTFENLQAVAQSQAELLRQGFEETTAMMAGTLSAQTPQEKIVRQAEASKVVAEKCMANMRDVTDSLSKCSTQAMETISNRMGDNLKELHNLIKSDIAA